MHFASRFVGLFLILYPLSGMTGIIYIDKVIQESNPAVAKVSFIYTHDAKGNSVTNVTFESFVTLTKMMVYITARIADDKGHSGVYRDLVKTVLDVEKLFQGSQSNPLLKGYFENIIRGMNFTVKFPMPPVSNKHRTTEHDYLNFVLQGTYKILNVIFDATFLQVLPDFQESVDFRAVGKYGGSNKMKYLGHIAISGGFRR